MPNNTDAMIDELIEAHKKATSGEWEAADAIHAWVIDSPDAEELIAQEMNESNAGFAVLAKNNLIPILEALRKLQTDYNELRQAAVDCVDAPTSYAHSKALMVLRDLIEE